MMYLCPVVVVEVLLIHEQINKLKIDYDSFSCSLILCDLAHSVKTSVLLCKNTFSVLNLAASLCLSPPLTLSPPLPPSLSPQGQIDSHIILDVYRHAVVTPQTVCKRAEGPLI